MNFISAYCFTQALHSHDICLEFVKKWTGRIVSSSLFLRKVTCGYNRLSLNLYVIRMFLSTVFVLLHLDSQNLWLQNLSFDLLSKWLLNLELIWSSQGQNEKSVHCFWSLVDIGNLIIQFLVCIALILFSPISIYSDRDYVICFKEVLKDFNVNLIMK